jgi:hypothetical protein
MEEQVEAEEEARHHRLVVTVHNEDEGGEPFRIPGEPETHVEKIIEKFYADLGTTRQEGDRLYCLANGDDVFSHAHQHLAEYAEHVCTALEWGFSRPTGGA